MCRTRFVLVPLLLLSLTASAPAGIFSRGKPKTNSAERVPELVVLLRTDKDEAKRTAAAEELRQYDPKAHPEILATLIDALAKDASPAVRSEVATSIGRLRPISQQAGYALEQATANDGSMRVRMSARQALWQYHLVGYRSGKPTEMQAPPATPVAAAPTGPSTPPGMQTRVTQRIATGPFRETPEPPLAEPLPTPAPMAPAAAPVPQPPKRVSVNPPKSSNPSKPIAPPPPLPAAARKASATPPMQTPPAPPRKPVAPPAPPKTDGPELPF
jgi:hypothetical protein